MRRENRRCPRSQATEAYHEIMYETPFHYWLQGRLDEDYNYLMSHVLILHSGSLSVCGQCFEGWPL